MASDGSPLTTDGGTKIRWSSLFTVVFGVIFGTFIDGIARLIGGIFDALLIGPLRGLASFLGSVVSAFFDPFVDTFVWADKTYLSGGGAIQQSVDATASFVGSLGPLGYVIAIVIVLAMAGGMAVIWRRVA